MVRRGFTLLELLIVILIISILSSLLMWGIHAAIETAKASNSQAMLQSISGALQIYKSQFGDYPPSSLDAFKVRLPNDTNNGIETLVACISTKKKGGQPFYTPPTDDMYVNVDSDKVDKNPTQWIFGDTELREFKDFMGNCLWYIHHSDYDKPKPHHLKVIPSPGAKKIDLKVYQSDKTKTPANPGRFQLVSPGLDGEFGTPDDLKTW